MDDTLFATIVGAILLLVISCAGSRYQAHVYISHSERIAADAGWEWIGCDIAYAAGCASRVTCLVKDESGKAVDIDNIRSD